jgi:hypothetical protein
MADLRESARDPRGDFMQATPREPISGFLSDLTASLYSPERTQTLQGIARFFDVPELSRTLNRLSYGEPITNIGKANVPLIPDDTAAAAMLVAPVATQAARFGAKAGRTGAKIVGQGLAEGLATRQPMMPSAFSVSTDATMLQGPAPLSKPKTWDATAAQKAKMLADIGTDPKTIWEQTGTWKGPDGKWRQELMPENINIKESLYETAQEGPFFRVQPKTFAATGQKNRGIREEIQQPDIVGGTNGSNVPQPISDETVDQFVNTPNNFVRQIADEFTQRTSGQKYELPKMPPSSLAKQSAIGRTFQLASEGDELYKNTVFEEYGKKFPQLIESTGAKNYDQLLEASYLQLAKETQDQFYSLPVSLSYHRTGEGSYSSSKEMLKDVYGNKHLYVYQGGDPHDFLNAVDPQTKLNTNEMFRAVHDFYGHAVHGNQFGAKGEEIAYGAHSQMFSPLARIAMASETRGQNSFVNYTPINAELKARINKLNGIRYEANRSGKLDDVVEIDKLLGEAWQNFQFAPQKSVLLPPEFLDISFTGGMPKYIQPLIKPELGTTFSETLTHFSNRPDLTFLDPSRYGQGIKGREMERLLGTENPVLERSYAYIGDPSKVRAEPGLGIYKYGAESKGLYNLFADPLAFRTLAMESSRTPFTSKYNQGIPDTGQAFTDVERMAKEYGYEGAANPEQGTAILFGPTAVKRAPP